MGLRRFARGALPAPLVLAAMRALARARRHRRGTIDHLVRRLGSPSVVLSGPFAGLTGLQAVVSPLPALLLGCYERELHPVIESLIGHRPDLVVNVGAGEGYYAVGLARRLPEARVLAWDTAPLCRAATRRVARRNGAAARVEVHGWLDPEELERRIAPAARPAVVSDCEGGELALLDPLRTPTLARTLLLVEAHDQFVPGVSRELERRFSATHRTTVVRGEERRRSDLPPVAARLDDAELGRALDDGRIGDGLWLWLEPRAGGRS